MEVQCFDVFNYVLQPAIIGEGWVDCLMEIGYECSLSVKIEIFCSLLVFHFRDAFLSA